MIPGFYTSCSRNSPLISANTFEKYIVSKYFCIAHHDDKMCFLLICRYHIFLKSDITKLLPKLDAFGFNFRHVDCLYTPFKYQFSGKILVKSGRLFDNEQRAAHFNHQHRGVDRMPRIAKKRLVRKKYEKHLLRSFQRIKPMQTRGSIFADRFDQVIQTKFELELIKKFRLFSGWSW